MSFERDFIDAVEAVCNKVMNRYSTITIGKAVNIREGVCDVERNGAPKLINVRMNALEKVGDSYITIVPKVNSFVLCGVIENTKADAVLLTCSEVEKILWKVGNMEMEVTKDGIVMNGGGKGGIPIASKVDENLDAIKQRFTMLETAIATGLTSAAGMDTSAGATFTSTMQANQLTYQNIENPDVKH